MTRAILTAALVLLGSTSAWAQTPAPAPAPAAQPDVDLKLFDKAEVDRSKGCSVVLWQANRDPEKDRFAYIFDETLAPRTHARQPARIKIGGQILTMTRIATGGKTNGYNLYEHQLYKLPGANDYVIIELKLEELMGETIDADSGSMSIVMQGKQVFRASIKGNAGCNTPAAQPAAARAPASPPAVARAPAAPPVTNNDMAGMFERYNVRAGDVPRVITQAMAKQFGCEAATMRKPVTGYQLSEESAIWQIPCGEYAANQTSAVFALVHVGFPAKQHTFLPFKWPNGQNRGLGDHAMMAPKWDLKTRTVTSIYTEGNGKDCGSLERHKVTEDGTFQLVELRYRETCDGKSVGAENFPMIFRAR